MREANDRSLQGRAVLVTGAGVRLGRAIAEGVGALGAKVAVHYAASGTGAEQAVEAICRSGGEARPFQADLRRHEEIDRLVAEVEAELGPVEALVNSAACFERRPFLETSEALLEWHWALNARAPFLLSRAVARGMVARGRGDIVNILDIGGVRRPWRGYAAYGMSKAALASLTECLALELAPAVRVNAVAPGTVLPPQGYTAEALEELRKREPFGRFGAAAEVVETVVFLLTGPRFLSGQIVAVDGARSLGTAAP